MNVTAVESTTLATIAYDAAKEMLQIEFRSRAIYRYFNRVIRGGFPYSLASNAQTEARQGALLAERSR